MKSLCRLIKGELMVIGEVNDSEAEGKLSDGEKL
jgi:hypothetical protein